MTMRFENLRDSVKALACGELSAVDYHDLLTQRIAAREPELHSFAHILPALSRTQAQACDARREAGEHLGPLHGIPLGIKDVFDAVDWPAERGSPLYAGHRPERDAVAVQALRAAGAYVLGKTVSTEFAFLHPGPTRNPHNPQHTPGGSSSGSAAAVAAGFVPAAIGTQTNASIIRPAAYCGVVGFKLSSGSIPNTGVFPLSATLDQAGVFARNVCDAGIVAAVLADDEALAQACTVRGRAPRLGYIGNFPWTTIAPDAVAHFAALIDRLRAAGAQVEEFALSARIAGAQKAHRSIMFYEAARQHAQARELHRAQLSEALLAALDEGAAIGGEAYRAALVERAAMTDVLHDGMEIYDAILSPAATGPAPPGLGSTGDPGCATLWTFVGMPALTLPSGRSREGLPYGLQLAAGSGADAHLLGIAHWCETQLNARL